MSRLNFPGRYRGKADLIGTFVKVPSINIVEILARSGLDFIVIDQEHAPFDRVTLDATLFAARALDLPALVRVPDAMPAFLQAALDAGAAGVLVPHVDDVATATATARACRYATGRGFSGATRSAQGGGGLARTTADADRDVLVIAQVESPAGLAAADGIAACAGIDGVFIGRADLAVAMGEARSDTDAIWAACRDIADAARAADIPLCAFAGGAAEADTLRAMGATMIVHGSDQALLAAAASQASEAFHANRAASAARD